MKIVLLGPDNTDIYHVPWFDIYARPEYGISAEYIDRGNWRCASDLDGRISFSYIERPIEGTDLYDIVTPYGYGGISHRGSVSEQDLREFRSSFLRKVKATGAVSEFARLSPLDQHDVFLSSADSSFSRSTFGGEVRDHAEYFAATDSRHRRAVRKAASLGLRVVDEDPSTLADPHSPFRQIYDSTMARLNARQSLRLSSGYFEALLALPGGSLRVLVAMKDDVPVGAALFLSWADRLHYHLSGATDSGRSCRATNFIIDHAVLSDERERFTLHLGGGLSEGDSLERFKRLATPQRFVMYYTRKVIDATAYRSLSRGSAESDYFPAYRAQS